MLGEIIFTLCNLVVFLFLFFCNAVLDLLIIWFWIIFMGVDKILLTNYIDTLFFVRFSEKIKNKTVLEQPIVCNTTAYFNCILYWYKNV